MGLRNAFEDLGLDTTLREVRETMKLVRGALTRPMWIRANSGAIRVTQENSAGAVDTLTSISLVTSVTTINQWGGFPLKQTMMDATERSNWAVTVRRQIT